MIMILPSWCPWSKWSSIDVNDWLLTHIVPYNIVSCGLVGFGFFVFGSLQFFQNGFQCSCCGLGCPINWKAAYLQNWKCNMLNRISLFLFLLSYLWKIFSILSKTYLSKIWCTFDFTFVF